MALASLSRSHVCQHQRAVAAWAPAKHSAFRTQRPVSSSHCVSRIPNRRNVTLCRSADEQATPANAEAEAAAAPTAGEETVFFEGSGGAPAELAISLLLAATVICIPLTIASVGRRLWIKFRFTNRRVSIINTSPLFAKQVDVAYSQIKEIRSVPRGLGLWGDMVIFLKDGNRLELAGLEKYKEIKAHIESCMAA